MRNAHDDEDADNAFVLLSPPQHPAVEARIANLPALAREQYLRFDRASIAAESNATAKFNQLAELQQRLSGARLSHEAYASDIQRSGRKSPEGERQLKQYAAAVKGIQKEIARIQGEKAAGSLPLEKFFEFFAGQPQGIRFRDVPVIVTPRKGETALDALKIRRATIAEKDEERGRVKRAQVPLDDAIGQMIRNVEAKAADGQIKFARTLFRLENARGHITIGEVGWPTNHEPIGDGYELDIDRANSLIAWMFKDQIIARGMEALKAAAKPNALSDASRKTRLQELDAELLELEREEEALVRLCEAEGTAVRRRSQASVLAILAIEPGGATDPDDWLDGGEPDADEAEREARLVDDREIAEGEARRRKSRAIVRKRMAAEEKDGFDFG